MSLTSGPARRRRRLAITTATLLAVPAFATSAHAIQIEQVSRADGVAGAAPIESHWSPGVISEDGTSAYFVFGQDWGAWRSASGIWRRDLVTNKTTQILGGVPASAYVSLAGLSTDGKVLGFRTAKRLVGADKNNVDDLYAYDTTTGRTDLVSRWDGPTADASGLTGPAFLTRDGRTALYSTSAGIARRTIATGKTVKVADGALSDYTPQAASTDGTVFATSAGKLISPRGTDSLLTDGAYGPTTIVSPNGRYAVVTDSRVSDGKRIGFWLDTTTGVRTVFDPESLGIEVRIVGFTPDNRALVARSNGASSFETLAITLPTAAAARQATYAAPIYTLGNLATTGRFATLSGNGPTYVAAPDGATLPGGADLPSPAIYSVVYPGCLASGWPFYLPGQPSQLSGSSLNASYLPELSQLQLRLTTAAGALISTTTIAAGSQTPYPALPTGGGFKLTATAKYRDGRTTAETWTIPAPYERCSISF